MDLDNRKIAVRHSCDNPPCFEPSHLTPGSFRANTQDALAKGRLQHTHCYSGHEFTPENTYVYNNIRSCRRCNKLRGKIWRKKQKRKVRSLASETT